MGATDVGVFLFHLCLGASPSNQKGLQGRGAGESQEESGKPRTPVKAGGALSSSCECDGCWADVMYKDVTRT